MYQALIVAEIPPVLPHQYIYAGGPYCEDRSKHNVLYTSSPALRYPGCLLQSSSGPFSVWTSSTDRQLFTLHGNIARSMPYTAEPFAHLSGPGIMAPFSSSDNISREIF